MAWGQPKAAKFVQKSLNTKHAIEEQMILQRDRLMQRRRNRSGHFTK